MANEVYPNETANSSGTDTPVEPVFNTSQMLTTWQLSTYKDLYRYWSPLIVFVGTIGNLLSLVVLLRPRMRIKSTFVYLAGVAACDIVYLYVNCFRNWLENVHGNLVVARLGWLCKSVHFLSGVSSHCSVWLIVFVTVERFLVVVNPLRAPAWFRRSRAFVAITLLASVLVAINAHALWTYDVIIDVYNATQCHPLPEFANFIWNIWYWIDPALYSFIPFAIILTLNVLIIVKTRAATKKRQTLFSESLASQDDSNRLTTMLLTLSFTFLLTTSPMSVYVVYQSWAESRVVNTVQWVADMLLAETVCIHLMWTNHAINFFLYCLVGKKFRQELVQVIHCRWKDSPPRRDSLSTNVTYSTKRDVHDTKLRVMQ